MRGMPGTARPRAFDLAQSNRKLATSPFDDSFYAQRNRHRRSQSICWKEGLPDKRGFPTMGPCHPLKKISAAQELVKEIQSSIPEQCNNRGIAGVRKRARRFLRPGKSPTVIRSQLLRTYWNPRWLPCRALRRDGLAGNPLPAHSAIRPLGEENATGDPNQFSNSKNCRGQIRVQPYELDNEECPYQEHKKC
jgi:hypothetical protein